MHVQLQTTVTITGSQSVADKHKCCHRAVLITPIHGQAELA